jgi:hypothetical protein
MKLYKFYMFSAGAALCLLLSASCRTQTNDNPQTVKLALKLKQGQSETYRLQTISQRQAAIQGAQAEAASSLRGGQTTNKIEMVFDQYIEKTSEDGNAIVKITIKELKYFAEVRDKPVLDFDSSKNKDPNNALAALIGHGYTIEVTPSGNVAKVIDINDARTAIKNKSSNIEAALRLLADKTIERQHSIPLPDANDNELSTGETWNNVVIFDFDRLGIKSYERIFKLQKVEKVDGNEHVLIEMNAIPSVEGTRQTYQQPGSSGPMTDIRLKYTGQMNFNVTEGTLTKYQENLNNEWLIVFPVPGQSGPPLSLSMTAVQLYDIEKIN